MERLASLSVGTNDNEEFYTVFQELSELAANLGVNHEYVSVTSSVVGDEVDNEESREDLYHDEFTLTKVLDAIMADGLKREYAEGVINRLQNAGILFRERSRSQVGL